MGGGELYRLQRALERLMAGHREALGLMDQEVDDREFSAQETLAGVQDILSGALEDARSILESSKEEHDERPGRRT
jgi:hypothetical protein